MKNKKLTHVLVVAASLFSVIICSAQTKESNVIVINLTQTPNEFDIQSITLEPGKYQFRVTNSDVEKEVGFVIQKESDKNEDVTKTALVNSFTTSLIKKGETQVTGVVELSQGRYVYSCPLNPTPKYILTIN